MLNDDATRSRVRTSWFLPVPTPRFPLRLARNTCTTLFAAVLWIGAPGPVRAEDQTEFREIETKYIFGFTSGSGIGLEGEKEVSAESVTRLGKRNGGYAASETRLEFEHTPTQYIQIELGVLVASHQIRNVTGLDDRDQTAFSGAFGELRYLLVERGPSSPFAMTLSVEPEWRRIDETSGKQVSSFELESRLSIDAMLVENRVYAAFNLLYEPEWTRADSVLERESTLGLSAALTFRPIPSFLVGAEVGYYRHYDAIGLTQFVGDAIYVGPTLYAQITRKSFVTAAWQTQVAGHSLEEPGPLNLHDFARHRLKLKAAVEF